LFRYLIWRMVILVSPHASRSLLILSIASLLE
jgi:hypothetical protein